MALADHNASVAAVYHLDEASGNAADTIAGHDLTETGGTIGAATGKLSGARDFELADSEWFERADSATLSTGDIDFTLACWVNFESLTQNHGIVCKSGVDYEYGIEYRLGENKLRWRLATGSGFAGLDHQFADTFGTVSTATWYCVVCWHDSVANEIGISVNGVTDTKAWTGGVWDGVNKFFIGDDGFAGLLDGLVDEVILWKGYVLSSADRAEFYNSGAGFAYPFDTGIQQLGGGMGGNFPLRRNVGLRPRPFAPGIAR